MSFNYDDRTWTPVTASDAANDLMDRINTILASNGITNFLRPIISNVVWIFCLAVGQIRAIFDQLLYQAQNSIDISNCADDQITNLLPIVGTNPIAATYTTIWLRVIATSGGSCVVPISTVLQYNSTISFSTLEELTVLASQTGYVQAICDTIGEIAVYDGQLTSFTSTIPNLSSVENGTWTVSGIQRGTVLGRELETSTEIRQRIINGDIIDNSLNGFIRALQGIEGIGSVNVVYNSRNDVDLDVTTSTGTVSIPPRQMWILTQDEDLSDEQVAEAWYNNSLIQTYNAGRATTVTQTIETLTGQEIEVYYDTSVSQNVYVEVNVPIALNPLSASNQLLIVNIILTLNNYYSGGQQVTAQQVDSLFSGFTTVKIYGCNVSLDGVTYTEYVDIYADALPLFDATRIEFNYI